MSADPLQWRPSLAELAGHFKQPIPWRLSLERYPRGIDNAHIDVLLSPRFTGGVRQLVRKLFLEEAGGQRRHASDHLVSAEELNAFRETYAALFEAAFEHVRAQSGRDLLALLQIALLKCLLGSVAAGAAHLQEKLAEMALWERSNASGRTLELHEDLVTLKREESAISRRVLQLLFRQIRTVEDGQLPQLRASLAGEAWPLPEAAFFNPVLLCPRLGGMRDLAFDYPAALIAEGGTEDVLFQTNQCLTKVFQQYLPPWALLPSRARMWMAGSELRRDQGQLKGFLQTEILLSRFLAAEEYRLGRMIWLDEPENLGRFLRGGDEAAIPVEAAARGPTADPPNPRWRFFQSAVRTELHRYLDLYGLSDRIILAYWLPGVRQQLGRQFPLSLLVDYVEGRLPRRRLRQRLEALRSGVDSGMANRMLERASGELRRLTAQERGRYLDRYLVDFLVLRRDLKLAYKAYEAMDAVRLLENPDEIRLSRSNGTLQELPCRLERSPQLRRVRAHAVLKADVRGSTQITEGLRNKGLNPASHFSLNFFEPVNKLLPEYGAEKLFLEGDAVILVLFEYEGDGPGATVARACGLGRKILQVVSLQNAFNRGHGLPELELGLGIAFAPSEPNFLYDEGHRIMISAAINRADRLCSCDPWLRAMGLAPAGAGFRVCVVRESTMVRRPGRSDLLSYNVNGIKLEEAAFFELQRELRLQQVRLPDDEGEPSLFFVGRYEDAIGHGHWLVVRYYPVRDWDGKALAGTDPERRHFFEVIVDERLCLRVRRLAGGEAP
jgi:class 3 adenylate cyclase